MVAAAVHQFNRPPRVIEERLTPTPSVGEVVARIQASALSRRHDHAAQTEWPPETRHPFVPAGGSGVKLLLLGAPASGKGTQADFLSGRLDIPSIATGNMLRAELAQRTELGLRAEAHMQRGDLVPDALMIDIIRERLRRRDCSAGFLLDGFPRTVPQAHALDALAASSGIGFDCVLYLKVPEPELIRRIASRVNAPAAAAATSSSLDSPGCGAAR